MNNISLGFFVSKNIEEEKRMQKKLIVVKVGTSSLTKSDGSISSEKIRDITAQLCRLKEQGHNVVLVSSGSIAAGFTRLGFSKRPTGVADRQASAAVGQGLLMEEYTKCFLEHGVTCGQLLLTRADFSDRRRYKNIFNAMSVLINRGVVPIINENDSIAIEELKLGDNDTLSAQVAALLHSDLLILLTDIDGLYTSNPSKDKDARHIDVVEVITDELYEAAGSAGSAVGTGGMTTKLKSAALATSSGVPVFICSSKEENSLVKAVEGTARGTMFKARHTGLKTKRQWMAFYANTTGNIYVDMGAAEALTQRDKSLLPKGIVAMEGDFQKGDVVKVFIQGTNDCIGKGIVNYSREELSRIMKGGKNHSEAINRDNWVAV
jgi:glutamate 5-kinase